METNIITSITDRKLRNNELLSTLAVFIFNKKVYIGCGKEIYILSINPVGIIDGQCKFLSETQTITFKYENGYMIEDEQDVLYGY